MIRLIIGSAASSGRSMALLYRRCPVSHGLSREHAPAGSFSNLFSDDRFHDRFIPKYDRLYADLFFLIEIEA